MPALSRQAVRSLISVTLSLVLGLMSPGIMGYQAAAQVIGASSGRSAASGSAGVSGANLGRPAVEALPISLPIPAPVLDAPALSLNPSLNAPESRNGAIAASLDEAPISQAKLSEAFVATKAPAQPAARPNFFRRLLYTLAPFTNNPQTTLSASRALFDKDVKGGALETGASVLPAASADVMLRHLSPSAEISVAASVVPSPAADAVKPQRKSAVLRYGLPALIVASALAVAPAGLVSAAVISGSLLLSVLLHESAHIWGLRHYGDDTPKRAGHDSLNPFHHIDMLGTVLLPAITMAVSSLLRFPILFGWAKPVEVDFNNIKDPKKVARVAMLGPATNAAIALAAGAALLLLPAGAVGAGALFLSTLFKMNVMLTLFNLIPLPWIDGGKFFISLFPNTWYAKWISNPKLPTAYQALYKRIYEGPSFILSWFGVESLSAVNTITRVSSFFALGALFAATFSMLHVPLLFLVLPCTYDYWCIREKVRSEAAVQDMMKLAGEWGAALVQIAEALGAKSEVSAYEAEHAMKNAVETAIDELMSQAAFKALTDEEKLAELMRLYPDYAAKALKKAAMSEDDDETIARVLKDSRNDPFYERLKKWVKDHDVFKKWGSPHEREKLKDSMKEADKKENVSGERGGGSPQGGGASTFNRMNIIAPLLLIGASVLLPHLAPVGIGLAAVLGSISPAGRGNSAALRQKVTLDPRLAEGDFWITFKPGLGVDAANEILSQHGVMRASDFSNTAGGLSALVSMRDARSAATLVSLMATDVKISKFRVHREVAVLLGVPEAPRVAAEDVEAAAQSGLVWVHFYGGYGPEHIYRLLEGHGLSANFLHRDEAGYISKAQVSLGDSSTAAGKIDRLSASDMVSRIEVAPKIARRAVKGEGPNDVWVLFERTSPDPQGDAQRAGEVLERHGFRNGRLYAENSIGGNWIKTKISAPDAQGAMEIALSFAAEVEVAEVQVGSLVAARLHQSGGAAPAPAVAPAVVPAVVPAPGAPAAPATSAAQPTPAAPSAPAAAEIKPREVNKEWVNFLTTHVLQDGKSKLNAEQIQLLTKFLRPVHYRPDAPTPPMIARNAELKKIVPILTSPRGMRNSVILVGEAGVGKTAVAEGLAQLIEDAELSAAKLQAGQTSSNYLELKRLRSRWLVDLNLDAVLGSQDPVAAINSLLTLIPLLNDSDPSQGNRLIVLMDEIQKIFVDESAGVKIANILKGPLRDGRISVIATTTEKEYKKHIESDDAFKRRLELVRVDEPTVQQTIEMLRGGKKFFEQNHNAVIPDESLVLAAKLYDQFDKANHNPDKSVKGIQDSAELARPENIRAAIALDIREVWQRMVIAVNEARQLLLDKAIPSALALPAETYNSLAQYAKKVVELYEELSKIKDGKGQVTAELIRRRVALKTGIEAGQLTLGDDDASRYVDMEKEMARRIVNQDRALMAIAKAIRRSKAAISNSSRPIAKFLLVGPTGVGKTYVARELARFLFKDPEAMVRFDMSEYQQEHEVARLIGSPPGYVGHLAGGQLTERIRKRPYSVILFDEIEKAHPKVWDILLQILDHGRLTDGEGKTVDFNNTVILISSNAGMETVDNEKFVALLDKAGDPAKETDPAKRAEIEAKRAAINQAWDEEIALAIKEGITRRFRPELIGRFDEDPQSDNRWIVFNRLRPQDAKIIARLQLKEFQSLLHDRHDTDLEVSEEVLDRITTEGFSPLYGARPMDGAITKMLVDPLATWILTEAAGGRKEVRGGLIKVTVKDGKIAFEVLIKPKKAIERVSLEGAAEKLTRRIIDNLEALARASGEEPTEALFDSFMRVDKALLATANLSAAFFNPDAAPSLSAATPEIAAASPKPNAKDEAVRNWAKSALSLAAANGWGNDVLTALEPATGSTGEGWIKRFVRHAKEKAVAGGSATPLRLVAEVDRSHLRLVIHSDHAISQDEKNYLAAHFTGPVPESYLDAQNRADALNQPGSTFLWDHNLLDLYRRISQIPGARIGYAAGAQARGGAGTDYWLEISAPLAPASGAPQAAAAPIPVPIAAPAPVAAPIAASALENTKTLMLGIVKQGHLGQSQQDGPGVKVAAAKGYAMLAGEADAIKAREWLSTMYSGEITDQWPLAMTAAEVLERLGQARDIPLLEQTVSNMHSHEHLHVPLRNALTNALAAVYIRAGLAEARAAMARNVARPSPRPEMEAAALKALGELGNDQDLQAVKANGEAYLSLISRVSPEELSELRQSFRSLDETRWRDLSAERKVGMLLAIGSDPAAGDAELAILSNIVTFRWVTQREIRYTAAQQWAEIVGRENRVTGLPQAMEKFLNHYSVRNSHDSAWGILLAWVYTLRKAGGRETLGLLEEVLKSEPRQVASVFEQPYFESPLSWAKILLRNGLFNEYSQPQRAADGTEKKSKLMEMLASSQPMVAAAAVYAIALAQRQALDPVGAALPAPKPLPELSMELDGSETPPWHEGI